MAWLTPEEFKEACEIERGRSWFSALLLASKFASDEGKVGWVDALWGGRFNDYDHWEAANIASDNVGCRSIVFVAAAAIHADLENQRLIEIGWPGLNEEISIRYNTAGGMFPGEQRTVDGKLYECIDEVRPGMAVGRKVVEVSA